MAETTMYVQVEPEFYRRYGKSQKPMLRGIFARRLTQRRPDSPLPGSVVVKLTLSIPDEAFLPLAPEATIAIPLSHTEPVLVESEPVEVLP